MPVTNKSSPLRIQYTSSTLCEYVGVQGIYVYGRDLRRWGEERTIIPVEKACYVGLSKKGKCYRTVRLMSQVMPASGMIKGEGGGAVS